MSVLSYNVKGFQTWEVTRAGISIATIEDRGAGLAVYAHEFITPAESATLQAFIELTEEDEGEQSRRLR